MSISRITPSLLSATNETTLALANFNFDLSLVKLDAPSEFKDLGRSLTRQRREMAEEGAVHRTARRLGILFESIAPNALNLGRAYGSRVSEISRNHTTDDLLPRHGVFAECAGVDGTSVWAAATSGKTAITVHLLACMLARAWSSSQATSIWVEVVEARKKELKKQITDGLYNDTSQLGLAASADLSRSDLAQWDASTRAWLQVADDAQLHRQKQLMLIVNNISMPVNHGTPSIDTYARVIEAWKTAVEALERLFGGQHQSVSKGSVLLGLASWHLYPDLLIFGETSTTVQFSDPTAGDCGQLTIGLFDPDTNKDEGVYWSLSLSHLRFYGDPVKVTSFTTRDGSRLSLDEFHLLILGAMLSDCGSLCTTDFTPAAELFAAMDAAIRKTDNPSAHSEGLHRSHGLYWDWGWVRILGNASRSFLALKDTERQLATSIIALGQRRGRGLLKGSTAKTPPLMGMCHPWIYHLLKKNVFEFQDLARGSDKANIEMMRFIAQKLDLRHNECIIRIKGRNTSVRMDTYVTALPHVEGNRTYHMNWVEVNYDSSSWRYFCNCHSKGHSCHHGMCPCYLHGVHCSMVCHAEDVDTHSTLCPGCEQGPRVKNAEQNYRCTNLQPGEAFRYVQSPFMNPIVLAAPPTPSDLGLHVKGSQGCAQSNQVLGPVPPNALRVDPTTHINKPLGLCGCFYRAQSTTHPTFVPVVSYTTDVALFVRIDVGMRSRKERIYDAQKRAQKEPLPSINQVTQSIISGQIPGPSLVRYLNALWDKARFFLPKFRKGLGVRGFSFESHLASLHALSLATKTYQELPGATINLQIISMPLHHALWLPDPWVGHLNRQQKFSCIAMFESGCYNMDPRAFKDVIAISSRNSIFASSLLHHDPSSLEHVDNISRVVGNVGKTGMVLMVAPQAPRLRKVQLDNFRLVSHAPFDGKSEDNFKSTSLHLRFTEYEMAFDVGERGAIDKDVCLVETLIQVYDRDQWIADIDVLSLFQEQNDAIRRNAISCTGCSTASDNGCSLQGLISVDNWEELLDTPRDLGRLSVVVFRGYGNWLAKLAAACICIQRGYRIVINPSKQICWQCCCRKKWGWAATTLVQTSNACRQHDRLEHSRVDQDSDASSDNDGDILSSDSNPEDDLVAEERVVLQTASFNQDYDSDDSTGTTYSLDGNHLSLQHMPQVFII
jgi:hypothetical protein